ncbi:hypothetical protein NHQ30_000210 [Ciborinia camelliae]|nr:hypothetical protein NHQ30_000210 [Ciborinia camelliae]
MSSQSFPPAITLSKSPSEEEPHQLQSQLRSESQSPSQSPSPSPSPSPFPPIPNLEIQNPIQHFYSQLPSAPRLGSSPASVVYSPLPLQAQAQLQLQTPLQLQSQQSSAAPPPSQYSPSQQSSVPPNPPHHPKVHQLLVPFIPPPSYAQQNQPGHQTPNQNTYSPIGNLSPFPSFFVLPSDSESGSGSDSESEEERERGRGRGRERMTWEEYEEEMKIERAKRMCAWFTGVMAGGLVGVGIVRWWVYG